MWLVIASLWYFYLEIKPSAIFGSKLKNESEYLPKVNLGIRPFDKIFDKVSCIAPNYVIRRQTYGVIKHFAMYRSSYRLKILEPSRIQLSQRAIILYKITEQYTTIFGAVFYKKIS